MDVQTIQEMITNFVGKCQKNQATKMKILALLEEANIDGNFERVNSSDDEGSTSSNSTMADFSELRKRSPKRTKENRQEYNYSKQIRNPDGDQLK